MESDGGATCADRTTDRQAHMSAEAVATHESDSGTTAGTAGVPATAEHGCMETSDCSMSTGSPTDLAMQSVHVEAAP